MLAVIAYWAEVNKEQARLSREILAGKHPHQPPAVPVLNEDTGDSELQLDYVYLTSLHSRLHGTTPGAVSRAKLRLAAQALVNGTHRLASAEEIDRLAQLMRDNLTERQQADEKATNRRTFNLQLPGGKAAK